MQNSRPVVMTEKPPPPTELSPSQLMQKTDAATPCRVNPYPPAVAPVPRQLTRMASAPSRRKQLFAPPEPCPMRFRKIFPVPVTLKHGVPAPARLLFGRFAPVGLSPRTRLYPRC